MVAKFSTNAKSKTVKIHIGPAASEIHFFWCTCAFCLMNPKQIKHGAYSKCGRPGYTEHLASINIIYLGPILWPIGYGYPAWVCLSVVYIPVVEMRFPPVRMQWLQSQKQTKTMSLLFCLFCSALIEAFNSAKTVSDAAEVLTYHISGSTSVHLWRWWPNLSAGRC